MRGVWRWRAAERKRFLLACIWPLNVILVKRGQLLRVQLYAIPKQLCQGSSVSFWQKVQQLYAGDFFSGCGSSPNHCRGQGEAVLQGVDAP